MQRKRAVPAPRPATAERVRRSTAAHRFARRLACRNQRLRKVRAAVSRCRQLLAPRGTGIVPAAGLAIVPTGILEPAPDQLNEHVLERRLRLAQTDDVRPEAAKRAHHAT